MRILSLDFSADEFAAILTAVKCDNMRCLVDGRTSIWEKQNYISLKID